MELKDWLDSQLSIDIWNNKYRRNNETLDEWFDRVSAGKEEVKKLIQEKKFIFGGRILSNRGITDSKVTYSNCYVIAPPDDSIESIYDARKKLARTFSYGGGCGIDISKLSPAGATVRNQAKTTTGAVSFMEGFSKVAEEIGQNGRRGALMISIDCTHPDLPEFIDIKTKEGAVTKANISIKVNDAFMEAVENDKDWELSFTRPETGETIKKTVKAKKLFHKMCKNNWNWAEPGILYWDSIKRNNLLNNEPNFEYAGTNPCAEEPLPAGGSCLLGSINLSEFVVNPYTDKAFLDGTKLSEAVCIAVDALNDVLDEGLTLHPLKEQQKSVRDWRQIGLGFMGLADMLIKLNIEYGSEESIDFCEDLGRIIATSAITESAILAKELGVYSKYTSKVLDSYFFKNHDYPELHELVEQCGLRNSQLLTCAPTGSISLLLGCSNGIEPLFATSWQRKTESLHGEDVYYTEYPKTVKEALENGYDISKIPTAQTLDPLTRVEMQAVWQEHIDASISSTVNLPEKATVEQVEKIYKTAWKKGLKGITIYREGCKRSGILTTKEKKEKAKAEKHSPKRGEVLPVNDKDCIGFKRKLTTGCGSLHCAAYFNVHTGELVETYLSKGSTGGCNNFMIGLSRFISMAARAGVPIETIIDQLMSTGACSSYSARSATKRDTSKGSCCPMAVGYALKEMYEEFWGKEPKKKVEVKPNSKPVEEKKKPKCPQCGEELSFEGGCNICKSCGWSKCD